MTLFDLVANDVGVVSGIADSDADTHRRLADMGLIGQSFTVRFKRKSSMLVGFGGAFDFVLERSTAERIEVANVRH